jgi:predicted phage terminase large subunit-like protein
VRDGEQNDFSVCLTAVIKGRAAYIVDVFRKKLTYPDQRQAVIGLARRFQTDVVLVERAANGDPLIDDLRSLDVPGVPTPIGVPARGSKLERIGVQSHRIEAGDVVLPNKAPWLEDLRAEVLAFPNGRHDDQVDALSQLLLWLSRDEEDEITYIAAPRIIFSEV